jgi:hypothetical protein
MTKAPADGGLRQGPCSVWHDDTATPRPLTLGGAPYCCGPVRRREQ